MVSWSRENESLVEMPQFKLRAILEQVRPDWSKQVSFEANLDDLNEEAVSFACERFLDKYADKTPVLRSLSQEQLLQKMGLLIHAEAEKYRQLSPHCPSELWSAGPRLVE